MSPCPKCGYKGNARPCPDCASDYADTIRRNSEWEISYRVLGPSAVWPDLYVCEILTGPDRGEYVLFGQDLFSGTKTPEGTYRGALTRVKP